MSKTLHDEHITQFDHPMYTYLKYSTGNILNHIIFAWLSTLK